MPGFYLGASPVALGGVSRLMLGDQEIWPGAPSGPSFDAFTIHAWDPDSGGNASGIVPDAIGSRSLNVRRGASAVLNWDGQFTDYQHLVLSEPDSAAALTGAPRTLTFWYRRDTAADDYTEIVIYATGYPGVTGPIGMWTLSYGTGGFTQFTMRTSFDFGAGGNTENVVDNTWHFFAITLGSSSTRVYLDGTEFADLTWDSGANVDADSILRFGGGEIGGQTSPTDTFPTDPEYQFVGRYGDIRVHNKILSPAEIAALQTAGRLNY